MRREAAKRSTKAPLASQSTLFQRATRSEWSKSHAQSDVPDCLLPGPLLTYRSPQMSATTARVTQGRAKAMKAVIQRVGEASVKVDAREIAAIGRGLLVLLCVEHGDGDREAKFVARKVAQLRIFEDDAGKMNRSVIDVGGAALVVSQFTLAGDLSRGNRPGFSGAADPGLAVPLYERFCARLAEHGVPVQTGAFGAHMAVGLVNDGPVTIWMDTAALLA
jgi:D-aminoacyl-tRNA deacylase